MSSNRKLTVPFLLKNGFKEVDSWLISDGKLVAPRALPEQGGVYAFALDDEVQYVGLASRSLKQRLKFYCSPGASQRTNQRLKGIIISLYEDGQNVRVLIAHPEDRSWNGLRIRGPEGLEAALIEDFDLPWNVRGSRYAKLSLENTASPASELGERKKRGSVAIEIMSFVRANPLCTELQIAEAIYGPGAAQPRVNQHCRQLVQEGKLERLPTRPFTYLFR